MVFSSAYLGKEPMTYSVKGWNGTLDYLWYTHSSIGVEHAKPVFETPFQAEIIRNEGLPSAAIPSDHMPIGATFVPIAPSEEVKQWMKAKAAKEAKARAKAKAKTKARAKAKAKTKTSCPLGKKQRRPKNKVDGVRSMDLKKAAAKRSARKTMLRVTLERLRKKRGELKNTDGQATQTQKQGDADEKSETPVQLGSVDSLPGWVMVDEKSTASGSMRAGTKGWVIMDASSVMDGDLNAASNEAQLSRNDPSPGLFPSLFSLLMPQSLACGHAPPQTVF
uniref:Endonuclease/exonuclease/phosphatase domain-containing protein n=1 Tax=Lotharella globosa TaxID=91324 RepID=A0A6V3J0S6_9EUKA